MNKNLFLSLVFACSGAFAEPALMNKVPDGRLPIAQPVQQDEPEKDSVEDVFIEDTQEPIPTKQESKLGMILFQRPLTEAIWPSSKPRAHERIERLDDWGAFGQYVTLHFAVYPLKELKNLRVQVLDSSLSPEIRLVRYWNIIYPNYNSYGDSSGLKRYRRMPEFLMPVTSCNAPEKEPQRFCLTFRIRPAMKNIKSIGGVISVSHDDCEKAVKLPFRIRVLPFNLKQDPKKHYTSYYIHARHKSNSFFKQHEKDAKLLHDAQLAEFKRMLEYGFTRPPVFNLSYGKLPDGTKDAYFIDYLDELMAELKEAGFDNKHAIPLCGSSAKWLYEKYTGIKLRSFHMENIDCDKIPQALYDNIESSLLKFLNYAKAHDYPDFIYNPIDEPSVASMPYVINIYKIFKKHGLKTFQTSPPKQLVEQADELFDIYNYGAFHVPYETATSGKKMEYWCYPNDNAYQIKDPYVMCHGGRMTYGLGYWRSGFHCIIPWIWRSATDKRLANSGGNLMWPDDGTLYMTTYWECFRLGVDDMRYIYTLQDAIVRRENSTDKKVQAAVLEARQLLQNVWNRICPQPAYLRENLLEHAEIDAIRAELAMMLLKLKAFPETQDKAAPSVIIDTKGQYVWEKDDIDNPNIISMPLRGWEPIAKELSLKETENCLDVKVGIDHKSIGEMYPGATQYPMGWPRIKYKFKEAESDFTKFSHIAFDLTVSSDRDIQNDYSWPLGITFNSKNGSGTEFRFVRVLEPNIKHNIIIPLTLERLRGINAEGLKSMSHMQLFLSENTFPHGSNLHIVTENIRLIGYSVPTLVKVSVPKEVALPVNGLSIGVRIGGVPKESNETLELDLLDSKGKKRASTSAQLSGNVVCGFAGSKLAVGDYKVHARIVDKNKTVLSEMLCPMRVIKGPAAK